jgi:hypothetical protein
MSIFFLCVTWVLSFLVSIKTTLVGFEVLTLVVMKSSVFWNITPYSPLKVSRRFGGTYRFHLQGQK